MKEDGTQLNALFQGQALEMKFSDAESSFKVEFSRNFQGLIAPEILVVNDLLFLKWYYILTVQALYFVPPDLCSYLVNVI